MISYRQSLHNERWNQIEIVLATPFIVVIQQYIPVLITRLGGSPLLIGLITSGAALMLTLASALAPRWMRLMPTYGRAISISLLIFRSVMIAIPLLLLLPAWRAEAITAVVIVVNLFAGFANMTLTAYLPRMTLPDRLARLVSLRWTMLGLGMTVFTPLLAFVLDGFAMPVNYIIACAIALVVGLVGIWALAKIQPVPDGPATRVRASGNLRVALAHAPARNYLIVTFLVHFSLNAPAPLITLHMVRELGATDTQFGWYLAVFWLALTIAGLTTSSVIRRFGNGRTFAVSMFGLALFLLILAFAQTFPVTWVAAAIGGAASVFFQVASYALVIDYAPPEQYEGFLSIYTAVANFCIFAGPLIMSGLVDSGWVSIFAGLLICVALRVIAGVLALRSAVTLPLSGDALNARAR
jgi:MFS family permease